MITQDLLAGDPNSILFDGLPDLSKFIFIHSSIDDAGLDPYEFRVFCHLRRRAKERIAYPGMRSISKVTGISLNKVCRVISSLQKKGFLSVRNRPGNHQTNIYYVGLPQELHQVINKNSVPVENAATESRTESSVPVEVQQRSCGGTQGNPLKGIQEISSKKKISHSGKGDSLKSMNKHKKTDGQLPLPGVPAALEKNQEQRPPGCPSLAVITQETRKLGLPDTDAAAIYNSWLMNGFVTKNGNKIKSWKGAINVWHLNKFFPSQKTRVSTRIEDERAQRRERDWKRIKEELKDGQH